MDTLLERFHMVAENRTSGRYTEALRSIAVEYAQQQIRAGQKLTAIAKELKVTFVTLKGWICKRDASFMPVEVCPESTIEEQPGSTADGITLITPRGYRLEGLDLQSAYRLLQLLQ